MTCPPHDYQPRPDRLTDHGTYRETVSLKGKACSRCPATLGPDKGIERVRLRQKEGPAGPLPDWLISELRNGVWTPRWPRSQEVVSTVKELVAEGAVDATFRAHPKTGALVVERVDAPNAATQDSLSKLRSRVRSLCPDATDWAQRATFRDLELATRILDVPNYRRLSWPSRVWNAAFREHSKQGDAARVASAIGGQVRNRASTHGIWFYGNGAIRLPTRTLQVDGELVVPEAWLRGPVTLEGGNRVGVVENRDLASIAPGFVVALDGHLGPTHRHILEQVAAQGIPMWLWTDLDGAGITIMRQVRQANPHTQLVGLHEWPAAWAREASPEQRNQVLDAISTMDDMTPYGTYVHRTGWFEQERIFAEADIRGITWDEILTDVGWPWRAAQARPSLETMVESTQ